MQQIATSLNNILVSCNILQLVVVLSNSHANKRDYAKWPVRVGWPARLGNTLKEICRLSGFVKQVQHFINSTILYH